MQNKLKNYFHFKDHVLQKFLAMFVSLSLIVSPVLPAGAQVLEGLSDVAISKVMVIPVGTQNSQMNSDHIMDLLHHKLSESGFVYDAEITRGFLDEKFNVSVLQLNEVQSRMNQILDEYADYKVNEADTQIAISSLSQYLSSLPNPSKTSSKLLISAKLTEAWLAHKSGHRQKAADVLKWLFLRKPVDDLNLEAFPESFKNYFSSLERSVSQSKRSLSLAVSSVPHSASVYIDGIRVGDSPVNLKLAQGPYQVSLGAPGRKSWNQIITLNEPQSIEQELLVDASKVLVDLGDYNQINFSKGKDRKNFAKLIAQLTQTQGLVFVSIEDQLVRASIYDAGRDHFVKNYSFKEFKNEAISRWSQSIQSALQSYNIFNSSQLAQTEKKSRNVKKEIGSKKPVYKKPWFWALVAGAVGGVATTAVVLTSSSSSSSNTGGVNVSLSGL